MKGGEFLQTSHPPEAKHRPLTSSEWLMRVLGAVVQPPADFPFVIRTDGFQGRTVRRQTIRNDHFYDPMAPKRFLEEFQCCFLVPAFGNEALEHFTLVMDGAPEVVFDAVDLHEDLVEVPAPMVEMTHRLHPTTTDFGREDGAEPVPPIADRFVRYVDAALVEKILDVPKRERVSNIHHYREADDLGTGLEVSENAGMTHGIEGSGPCSDGNPIFL